MDQGNASLSRRSPLGTYHVEWPSSLSPPPRPDLWTGAASLISERSPLFSFPLPKLTFPTGKIQRVTWIFHTISGSALCCCVLIHLIVRKLVLPSPPLLCTLPKGRAFLLPEQRTFSQGGRRTGGCGFSGMGAGAMSRLSDGQGTGCQAALFTLWPGAPLF